MINTKISLMFLIKPQVFILEFIKIYFSFYIDRETIKIGIIYVGAHQEHQKEILMNQQGSKQYDWFLSNLAEWLTS